MNKLTSIALAAILSFVSCKKQETINPDGNHGRLSIVPHASCTKNQTRFENLFDNCSDQSEKAIDLGHYQMMKSMLSLANNKEFHKLIATAKESEGNCIKPADIYRLKNGMTQQSFDSSVCNVVHNGLYYKSVVFVPNAAYANYNLSPIFSPGIELYDGEGGNHDVIFGWYVNGNNDTIEINMGEVDYANTTRPILVASLELCEGQEEKIQEMQEQNGNMDRRSSFTPKVDGLRINFRYDNTNYSEVWISAVQTNTTQGLNSVNTKLRDVHKNDVGTFKSFGFDWSLNPFVVSNPSNERICYNAYEYDWFARAKPLGWCYLKGSSSGNVIPLDGGRRKFQDEWYSFTPGNLSSFELPLSSLSSTSMLINWNKGAFGVKK